MSAASGVIEGMVHEVELWNAAAGIAIPDSGTALEAYGDVVAWGKALMCVCNHDETQHINGRGPCNEQVDGQYCVCNKFSGKDWHV